ncbi:class II aldolase/adducin family protein [Nonomuraea cavernae]|uniref:class II aldolase/adducin family protein n=1 Tax=Nonomuraea cavernae TaxID=2045107 RepID=UPI0033F83C19
MDELFVPPVDRWEPEAALLTGRDAVLHRSHLVGADPALTKEGGGNFSAKGIVSDHRHRITRVLWMSAWGCDGAATTPADFPALRLDDLLELRASGPLSENGMIDYLVDCGLRGEQRRPGIETLTHAFIPYPHVDHCHPDAVIALTSFPGGRQAADAEFGDEAIWFDYRQFDVGVARELADRIAAKPGCRFVLLANHGLFTWADSSEECYRNSLEAVERATRAVRKAVRRPPDLGGQSVNPPAPEVATDLLGELLPAMRGALSAGTPGVVLHLDRSDEAVRFASSARGPRCTQDGPSCPDHLVTVGYRPLVLDVTPAGTVADPNHTPTDTGTDPNHTSADTGTDPNRTSADTGAVLDGIERHRRWYNDYYERHVPLTARGLGRRGDAPRAIVLPGLGAVTAGPDAAKARLCADHLAQTMTVIRAADAAGGYVSLTEAQGAADEYWPLMRLKPQLRPPEGPLAGKVFLVAASDDACAATVADRLAASGAHVALATESPRQQAGMAASAAEICARHGERRAVALPSLASDPEAAARDAVLAYGGFDVFIDLTRSGGLAPAALAVFDRQRRRGSVLLSRDGRSAGELELEIGRLEADAEGRFGLTVNAVATADPVAVAEAALFLAGPVFGPVSDTWDGTVLSPRQAPGTAHHTVQTTAHDIPYESAHDTVHATTHDTVHESAHETAQESAHDTVHESAQDVHDDTIHDNARGSR